MVWMPVWHDGQAEVGLAELFPENSLETSQKRAVFAFLVRTMHCLPGPGSSVKLLQS